MDRWRRASQTKFINFTNLTVGLSWQNFFVIKYFLTQFLYYLFYDVGDVYYEGVQKKQLMPINLHYFFKFRNESVINFGFLLLTF